MILLYFWAISVTPLEAIKVRQQTDLMNAAHQRKYHGIAQTAGLIVKNEG